MLLQVERVVLNALGKNTALAADICASRESLAIVFRTSRSHHGEQEQCPPMCTERKNLRTRTRLGVGLKAWPVLRIRCSGGLAETILSHHEEQKHTELGDPQIAQISADSDL